MYYNAYAGLVDFLDNILDYFLNELKFSQYLRHTPAIFLW